MMRFKLLASAICVVSLHIFFMPRAAAQVVQISGKVTLKQAAGSVVPVASAVIDIYRTDFKQKFQVTTNQRGEYLCAGLPMIGTYTIAVSAAGARPDYRAGLRPAQQPVIDFILVPGDGSQLTLEQIRAMPAGAPATPSMPTAESTETRRAREEMERKIRESRRATGESPSQTRSSAAPSRRATTHSSPTRRATTRPSGITARVWPCAPMRLHS